ncbi:MAG: RHS repeat-associated core domain-containing protein [Methanosarcinaceae archaeon]
MPFYAGLGDRHQQNGVNYTLDLATGLTQVLSDGTNTYLYGNGRISQHATQTEYFLGDALGSVRQLADSAGAVTLTQSYAPYGDVVNSVGTSETSYAFTGESRDANGLTYLRARYYNSSDGRFVSRDTWGGDYNRPLSLNRWGYVEGNPIKYVDSQGTSPQVYSPHFDRGYYCPAAYNWETTFWGFGDKLFSREQCGKLIRIWNEPTAEGLAEMEAWYYKLSDRMIKDGYIQAGKLLKHFLDGTGTDNPSDPPFLLEHGFVEGEIMKNGEVKNKISDLKSWYIKKYASCATSSIGPDFFKTGIAQNLEDVVSGGGISKNLVAALNSFRLDAVVRGQNTPWAWGIPVADWNLDIHVVAVDKYDWTKDGTIPYGGVAGPIIEDDWAILLESRGLASSFFVRGDYHESYSKTARISSTSPSLPSTWNYSSCIGDGYAMLNGICWQE